MSRSNRILLVAVAVLLLAGGGAVAVYMTVGLRNRNPGNLRRNEYKGSLGVDKDGYAIFDTMENGIRAIRRQLQTNQARGLDTVAETISSWAPPEENDTAAYIAAVSDALGIPRNDDGSVPNIPIDTHNPETLFALTRAIIRQENGVLPAATISDETVQRGLALA